MKVCVCKGIKVAVVMNHGTHQSRVIDQIPNTRPTEINTAVNARSREKQQLFIYARPCLQIALTNDC